MTAEVFVSMPLQLTPTMIEAVRENELTKCESMADWHQKLGWLICAYEVLLNSRPPLREAP